MKCVVVLALFCLFAVTLGFPQGDAVNFGDAGGAEIKVEGDDDVSNRHFYWGYRPWRHYGGYYGGYGYRPYYRPYYGYGYYWG